MTSAALTRWNELVAGATKPIIVHLPRNIGGNSSMLSNAMRELGATSISVSFEQDPFGFRSDITICSPKDSLLRREFRRLVWIFRILRSADILHFNSGTTLAMPSDDTARMPGRETTFWRGLRILHARYTDLLQIVEIRAARLLDRKMYMTFQGDDLRQGDRSLAQFEISIAQHVEVDYYNSRSDKRKRQRLLRYRRNGIRFFVLNPDLNWFLDGAGTFIPYSNAEHGEVPIAGRAKTGDIIRIVHAPSHRVAKGTAIIEEVIALLRTNGLQFEFEIIEGVDNSEAKRRISSADLLIDQLFAGWYGGVAVEAMINGVAVMSYIREDDLVHVPAEMQKQLPILRTDADSLATRIEWYVGLTDSERCTISKNSAIFASRWHSPRYVASRVFDEYTTWVVPQSLPVVGSYPP